MEKNFGRRAPAQKPSWPATPEDKILDEVTRKHVADDPYIREKVGARGLAPHIIDVLKTERGAHCESILTLLGAFGGFACLLSLIAKGGGNSAKAGLDLITTKNGELYLYGDPLHVPFCQEPTSIYGLTGGMAQMLGATEFPEVREIEKYVAGTLGTPQFGIPRVPDAHRAPLTPLQFLQHTWPGISDNFNGMVDGPHRWPALLGFTIQEALKQMKGIIDMNIAFRIVMESAVPMLHVNPNTVAHPPKA